MVFSDLFFLFVFIPAFALCYLISAFVDKKTCKTGKNDSLFRWRNWILVLFSLFFYAWGEPVYVLLMIASVFVNYFVGLAINRNTESRRKTALVVGLAFNIGVLAVFKYLTFFCSELVSVGLPMNVPQIALPIGISFYTFQSISYLVDVYRGESPVQHSVKNLMLYISMFPQLIAGPIVRYGTVANEITDRHVTGSDLAEGMMRFLRGLGKKVILANQLSEISTQLLTGTGLESLSTSGAWIGIVAFTLQIYFDFSGYSDMAIGIGRCLGFHFNENFNHPYCCNSITDFWRRWHMSLGSFFRDYVYIPLGGNRHHQPINILVVWMLTGFWHGASWNYLLWGLFYGIIIMLEKYTILRIFDKLPKVLLHIYSILLVIMGWGLFYFEDFGQMLHFFKAFFGNGVSLYDFASVNLLLSYFWLWIVAVLFCMPIRKWFTELLSKVPASDSVLLVCRSLAALILLAVSVIFLVGATNNAFLYTRF